ncbi:TonB-dependent receptor [Oxalobacteraceae bacterium A2-2]
MHSPRKDQLRPKYLSYAVSAALATLISGNLAIAQEAQPAKQDAAQADSQPSGEIQKVTVVATRKSQQSSIERKKNAATAMDSIVAEDVGSFPDRNVGEAISRIAGIGLDRGDYGEGVSVAVRGNSADLTRVEIDGQGVQAGGGTDLNNGGSGRGVEFRELPADLIKSVDVVKGSTADQTEGSLGGGILIKTRTGLDFNKPFVSVRVAGTQNSLNKQWGPDLNLVAADKYLDGRLGVVLNASKSTVYNEAHSIQNNTSGTQGYARAIDFDNSPNKTFSYQPSTLNTADPTVNTPIVRSLLTAGGYFNSATPTEILTKSAAAQSKADCYSAFPALTTAQTNLMVSNQRNAAIQERGNELISCLNQWNDYTPSLVRYFEKKQIDAKNAIDLRADFKVNNNLTIYGKVDYNKRHIDDNQQTYTLGGMNVNPATTTQPGYYGTAFTDVNGVRTITPGSGYYLYNTPSYLANVYPLAQSAVNINPASVTVDANHHVTKYTITDGTATTDQIHNIIETSSRYLQLGGTYKNGPVTLEFMAGDAKADWSRGDKRVSWSTNYGPATMSVLPDGLWTYSFPAGSTFNQADPTQYSQVRPATAAAAAVAASRYVTKATPAYTIAQQPLQTQAVALSYSPQARETDEKTAKADLTIALSDKIPFLTHFKTGFNFRQYTGSYWGGGGAIIADDVGTYGTATYQPGIYLPAANVRSTLIGCTDTAGSLGAGGANCKYGYNPSTDPRAALSGTTVVTQQQFQNIIAQSMTQPNTPFFTGASDRPAGLINGWNQIDVEKVFAMVGTPNVNTDCLKSCTASDGKVYQQPVTKWKERTMAGYLMTDFDIDHLPFTNRALPFGLSIDGNVGVRMVHTDVNGTGFMSFTSITKTAAFDPANPTAAAGIVTSTYRQNTSLDASTNDYMPSLNLATWILPDQLVLRYNHAKTIARPPITSLLPSGTCTYDQRLADAGLSQSCSTTAVGNPALRPQVNWNDNLSLEWYPNRDSMFTVSAFKQRGIVGPAITQGVSGVKVFDGSTVVDPQTGIALGDLNFDYTTWINGAATTRKGIEYSSKTAFTFLPWYLRYTGLDANYTRLRSATSAVNVVDLLTGTPLPPQRESKYTYNLSLWYDDGALSARVALQAVAQSFTCIAACGGTTVNNYPNVAGGRTTVVPYNPGSPYFKDTTRFVDAKIAYRMKNGLEFFIEGRNLGNATTSDSMGSFTPFADGTPALQDLAYSGRRITVGLTYRN